MTRAAKNHPDRALHEAAKTHAAAINAIILKIGAGLEEAEAARQVMVLIGTPIKEAILLAVNAARAGARVNRATAASSSNKWGRRAREALGLTASVPTPLPTILPSPRASKRSRDPEPGDGHTLAPTKPDDERADGARASKRQSSTSKMVKRHSSTGLSESLQELGIGDAAKLPVRRGSSRARHSKEATAAAAAAVEAEAQARKAAEAQAEAHAKARVEAEAEAEAKARAGAQAKAAAEVTTAARATTPPAPLASPARRGASEVSSWLDKNMLSSCKPGLASIGITTLFELANAEPPTLRAALKAVDTKTRSKLMRAIEEIGSSGRASRVW